MTNPLPSLLVLSDKVDDASLSSMHKNEDNDNPRIAVVNVIVGQGQ